MPQSQARYDLDYALKDHVDVSADKIIAAQAGIIYTDTLIQA